MSTPNANPLKPSRELSALLAALIDSHLPPDQEQRLAVLLQTEPGALDAYIDCVTMHAMLKWRHGADAELPEKTREDLDAFAVGGEPDREGRHDRAADPPGMGPGNLALPRPVSPPARVPAPMWESFFTSSRFSAWRVAAVLIFVASAVMTLTAPAWMRVWSSAPVATLADAVDAQWDLPQARLDVGDALPYGPLQLKSGYASVRLDNGVTLVLQGPTRFTVDSLRLMHLNEGRLTADVPHSAIGFTVRTPTAEVTDLGTTFGVMVAEDQTGEVLVLKGRVKAGLLASGAHARVSSVVTESHAVAFNAAAGTLRTVPAAPEAYLTDLRGRVALSLHSTGEGFRSGADPNWQISANTADPGWTVRSAVIGEKPAPGFRPGSSPTAQSSEEQISAYSHFRIGDTWNTQWLTTSSKWPTLPNGCTLTFKTTLDLTGFDPASARVHLKIMADDDLVETRLNGRTTDITFVRPPGGVCGIHEFSLNRGFKAGKNTLEFVVLNRTDAALVKGLARPSSMGLRVGLDGTAVRMANGGTTNE